MRVARIRQARVEQLLLDPGIVRNRLKVESTVTNAKAFLAVQREFGSFDEYIWGFVGGQQKQNRFKTNVVRAAAGWKDRGHSHCHWIEANG